MRDSKQLLPEVRECLYEYIQETAVAIGIGSSSSEDIDTLGIAKATRLAMVKAIKQLEPAPQFLLIDYFKLTEIKLPQKGVKFGDSLCFSIACASIVAKVTRDRLLVEMDRAYPGYGFAKHKGYGTVSHLKCLREKGPCPLHRRSFRPVSAVVGYQP